VIAAFARTEAPVDRTAEEWAKAGQLPFQPAPPRPPLPGHGIGGTVQLPVMGVGTGNTEPLTDVVNKVIAALPPHVATIDGCVVRFPQLTLVQYASLCATLAVWPEHAGVIMPRYRVETETARRALDAFWEAQFVAYPRERALFVGDLAAYTAWLRVSRKALEADRLGAAPPS
jgi:hypothetical protein